MRKINREKCTGCGACVQRCPKKCISWKKGEFDFLYPEIDINICENCGLCEKVCPIEKDVVIPAQQKVFAAVHKNADVLAKSTSGGAFTAIADVIFGQDGVVYGVAMQDGMKAGHIRIENKEELDILRGSKYLQSDTGMTYQQAERDLKKGRMVLYSGTPCQIDGLKKFLGKDYVNLYTADVVCHGVGSQAYFDKYMNFARERYDKIKELRFRSKEFVGWSCGGCIVACDNSDRQKEKLVPFRDFDNYYYSYFLSGDIYRKCCYSCKYANTMRVGDFTLGDYWGVERLHLSLNTYNGCSLLIVNNSHGEDLLRKASNLDMVETTIDQAAQCNKQLIEPSKMTERRQKRIVEYEKLSADVIQQVYLKSNWKTVLKGRLKAMMPYMLKLFIRGKRRN